MSEPLIYTIKGNLPISSLQLTVKWEVDPGNFVKCIELYTLEGEVVRESAHVLSLEGHSITAEAEDLNG